MTTGGPPLRVAVLARAVHPIHGSGGLERHTGDLVRHLLRKGLQIVLIAPPTAREAARSDAVREFLALPGLQTRFVPYLTFPFAGRRGTTVVDRSTAYPLFGRRAGRAAARLAEAGHVDVVHGHGASALGFALARRRTARALAPFVFNPHGLEEFGASGGQQALPPLKRLGYAPLRAAVRACAREADRVIATDRSLEPTVAGHLRVAPEVIRVVPNAIDLEACDRHSGNGTLDLRMKAGASSTEPLLLSVGRLERNKGFDVLARALGKLTATPWRWVVVGDGPYRSGLLAAIHSAGVAERALLTGHVTDRELHRWYDAAALFVHPTLYEGSSLVTLEAMSHRRAVVATRTGGLPDKVVDNVTGWLVEPGSEAALASALREALSAGQRLDSMGQEGRRLVEAAFSWSVVADRYVELYRELVTTARSERAPTTDQGVGR